MDTGLSDHWTLKSLKNVYWHHNPFADPLTLCVPTGLLNRYPLETVVFSGPPCHIRLQC